METQNLTKVFIIVGIYAIAMGLLESAVVVYLREIYYPEGFNFPLTSIDSKIAITEILREAATITMLITIGYLAGKSFSARFAWFIYAFAIWDIFYYIFLKLLLNWPESILTNDILFLIPVTWVGPVITPVIVSLSMILLAYIILYFENNNVQVNIKPIEWGLFCLGSFILILSFTWDYSKYILERYNFIEIFTLPDKSALYNTASDYIPRSFNWGLFICGQIIILMGILKLLKRLKKISPK